MGVKRDILAAPIADILNNSFPECKVIRPWKLADVSPLPKAQTICDFYKDLRPISLTSTSCKVAESIVIGQALKPVVLSSDLVDHDILVAKLLRIGVEPTAVNWLIDFLSNGEQRVKVNDALSTWVSALAGVPQGTRLDPWLSSS